MYQNTYLMHHGVKGMHWGVRRYQNPDGTRTNAGKRHERLMYKINEYRDNRAAAKQAKREARDAAKQAKQEARAEKRADLKAKLTSPEAKQAYKNIAKGAAITAGVLAAGYGAKLASEAYRENKNYKTAIKLADDIMANDTKFSKLGSTGRDAVRKEIIDSNIDAFAKATAQQANNRKYLRKDTVRAYLTPGDAGVAKRAQLRANKRKGAYDGNSELLSTNSAELKRRKKELMDLGRQADDPVAFAKKVEKRKQKAKEREEEAKHQQELTELRRQREIAEENQKRTNMNEKYIAERGVIAAKAQYKKEKLAQKTAERRNAEAQEIRRKNKEMEDQEAKRIRKNMKASRKMMKAQAKYGNQQ